MRNYFDFNLKGARLFPYLMVLWVVAMALMVPVIMDSYKAALYGMPDPVLDGSYLLGVALGRLYMFVRMLAYGLATFFVVKFTIDGLSLDGERPETEYDFRAFLWLCVKGAFFTAITFGIYLPWFLTKMVRYFAGNTTFRFDTFRFEGRPMMLFSFLVVFVAAPAFLVILLADVVVGRMVAGDPSMGVWLLPALLAFTVLSCFCRALSARWMVDFSYGAKRITTTVRGWQAGWFVAGQTLLSIITLGFYTPMAMLRVYRYYVSRMVLGGETVDRQFGFTLDSWRDYGYVLGQSLLLLVTVGIYMPWAYAKITTRLLSRTYVESVEEKKLPMPVTE